MPVPEPEAESDAEPNDELAEIRPATKLLCEVIVFGLQPAVDCERSDPLAVTRLLDGVSTAVICSCAAWMLRDKPGRLATLADVLLGPCVGADFGGGGVGSGSGSSCSS